MKKIFGIIIVGIVMTSALSVMAAPANKINRAIVKAVPTVNVRQVYEATGSAIR